MKQINLLQPANSQREIDAVTEVLKSGWWGTGPKTIEFEKKFAEFVGSDKAVAVNSCTSALHLALQLTVQHRRLRDKHNKLNIVVPSLTFVSTALVGLYEDCEIRFADVDEKTMCIDVKSALDLCDENTVAIIPVHYAGNTAPVKELLNSRYRPAVIEDCAHAVGNPEAGKYGLMSCWSFHPVKNLATGDMGAITFNRESESRYSRNLSSDESDALIEKRWCGISHNTFKREKSGYNWEYDVNRIGYKYNTNDIMASIALVQLDRIWELNEKRRRIADRYKKELADIPDIKLPAVDSGSWHLFVIRVASFTRDMVIEWLRERNISPGVHYKPIHRYPVFKEFYRELPITDRLYDEIISLPIHPSMTDEEQTYIIEELHKFFRV